MTKSSDNCPVPAFLLRADAEANRALEDMGLVGVTTKTKEQSRKIGVRVENAAQHLSFFMGRNVTVTSACHFVYSSLELDYHEQDAEIADGRLSGVFRGLIVSEKLLEYEGGMTASRVAVQLDTIRFTEIDDDLVKEDSVKTLTRIGDIISLTVGLGRDLA